MWRSVPSPPRSTTKSITSALSKAVGMGAKEKQSNVVNESILVLYAHFFSALIYALCSTHKHTHIYIPTHSVFFHSLFLFSFSLYTRMTTHLSSYIYPLPCQIPAFQGTRLLMLRGSPTSSSSYVPVST